MAAREREHITRASHTADEEIVVVDGAAHGRMLERTARVGLTARRLAMRPLPWTHRWRRAARPRRAPWRAPTPRPAARTGTNCLQAPACGSSRPSAALRRNRGCARYTLGLLQQQENVTQHALTVGFLPLLAPEFDSLPTECRIASLTGVASCLTQLGRRVEALEACEAAEALGAGGEVLFAKSLLLACLGKIDDAIATLKQLLNAIPTHLRAMMVRGEQMRAHMRAHARVGSRPTPFLLSPLPR